MTPKFIRIAKNEKTVHQFIKNYNILEIFIMYPTIWRDFTYFLALFINITMLLSFNQNKQGVQYGENNQHTNVFSNGIYDPLLYGIFYNYDIPNKEKRDMVIRNTNMLFKIAGGLQLTCCQIFISLYFIREVPVLWVDYFPKTDRILLI